MGKALRGVHVHHSLSTLGDVHDHYLAKWLLLIRKAVIAYPGREGSSNVWGAMAGDYHHSPVALLGHADGPWEPRVG